MEGLCVPGITRAVIVAILYLPASVMFGWTDPLQVLLHVVCHCEDNQLSVLSPCSAVLGISQYGIAIIALATSAVFMPPCSKFTQMSRDPGNLYFGVFQSQ